MEPPLQCYNEIKKPSAHQVKGSVLCTKYKVSMPSKSNVIGKCICCYGNKVSITSHTTDCQNEKVYAYQV